jgi:hypothetical protein
MPTYSSRLGQALQLMIRTAPLFIWDHLVGHRNQMVRTKSRISDTILVITADYSPWSWALKVMVRGGLPSLASAEAPGNCKDPKLSQILVWLVANTKLPKYDNFLLY